ncbi:hypothetical protein C9374_003341 [Naegleria lovaniensis]|uniref:PH domain-containing protein n=1 Tax=Naegleria lovaniensis TaxID=51637 RepID=A0AA88KLM8_NAELO|nr:uncharacterized protein C9374_003341 [Naegleria lovaniensis]KAG2385526.1 hypothetical protein C9374_003341 [Naegleria lovaniensis]
MEDLKPGRVFVWGKTTRNETEGTLKEPTAVPYFFDVPVLMAACGLGFTAILTEKREVYTLGSRSWYMTDYEHEDVDDTKNSLVHWRELSNKDVIQIVCGLNFCACLTRSGDIYTWGSGMYGQLGHREEIVNSFEEFKVPKPTRIDHFSNCIFIAAGEECMACITRDKHLYTWGKNFCGMLGHGDEKDVFEPKRVIGVTSTGKKFNDSEDNLENDGVDDLEDDVNDYESLEKEEIIHVACGQSHMACITAKNEIFTWGNNFLGPLGRILDMKQESDFYPRLVDLVQVGDLVTEENLKQSDEVDFVAIECLKYNTLALTSDGRLFSCGKGGCDGGGHGEAPRTLLCVIQNALEGKRVKSIAKSSFATHTGCIVLNNSDDDTSMNKGGRDELYIWGNNEDNKLGIAELNDESLSIDEASLLYPKKFPFPTTTRECFYMCCGETHTAAILKPHPSDKNPNPELTLEKFEKGETHLAATNASSQSNQTKKETSKIVEEEYDSESDDDDDDDDEGKDSQEDEDFMNKGEKKPSTNTTNSTTLTTSAGTTMVTDTTSQKKNVTHSQMTTTTTGVKTTTRGNDSEDEDADDENDTNTKKSQVTSSQTNSPATSSSPTPTKTTGTTQKSKTSTPVKELHGYLQKKGEKGFVKLWRKRWFNLEGNYLCYYEKEGGKSKGAIGVDDILDVLPGATQYGFNISTTTGRVYELQCTSDQELKYWTTGLQSLIKKK